MAPNLPISSFHMSLSPKRKKAPVDEPESSDVELLHEPEPQQKIAFSRMFVNNPESSDVKVSHEAEPSSPALHAQLTPNEPEPSQPSQPPTSPSHEFATSPKPNARNLTCICPVLANSPCLHHIPHILPESKVRFHSHH
jgi:hypothetical protein